MSNHFSFALLGNPNAGKSSVFNQLTGLRQKTGNFPGVTVEKKIGTAHLPDASTVRIIDLPGTYSLYPNAQDERLVLNILANPSDTYYPDAIVYVADLTNLERHLLLLTQLRDLNFPLILCIGMIDVAAEQGITLDAEGLSNALNMPVLPINGRNGEGIDALKNEMQKIVKMPPPQYKPFYMPTQAELKTTEEVRFQLHTADNTYRTILWAHHYDKLPFLTEKDKKIIGDSVKNNHFEDLRLQITETLQRFDRLQPILKYVFKKTKHTENTISDKIDRIVTHRTIGPVIFFTVLFFIFQAIFSFAEIPTALIEDTFGGLNAWLKTNLPESWATSLLTDGIIAGLSGVLVFIPQIAILFFLITLLEEVGYMARTVYLFDRIMQKVGLNGRSIVALISGGACAIPAIMSTRTISNWKERLITILVTPLISCSARIPVYTLLVGFVVADESIFGFNKRGLVFMSLYIIGVLAALIAAWVFKKILKTDESTFLAIELPEYRMPHWKNVLLNVWTKVHSFITEAGKTILLVSIVLWFLAAFGPADKMRKVEEEVAAIEKVTPLSTEAKNDLLASKKLEVSYAGHLGKAIEPIFAPLGFDWKIDIALISSFAAREVFVGTMATIYSIGSAAEDTDSIATRMKNEVRADGTPMYNTATGMSLLIFYVFAMQCVSTLAVVKRETKSWKWVFVQFSFMFALAYLGSLLTYNIF